MAARQLGKLTTIAVRNAKRRGLHGDGGGLFLQISPSGAKSWCFRFKVHGRHRVMGLGPTHTVSLAEARDLALACRKLRLQGVDPIEHRRAERADQRLADAKLITFRECGEAYIAAHAPSWKNAVHARQWPQTLGDYVYPAIGQFPVQAIDTPLVLKAIEPIWHDKPETANRVRGRIEAVLDWAASRGYRAGENPARWRGHLQNILPKTSKLRRVEHHAAMAYAEIGAFMVALRNEDGVAARALEFAILTAVRKGEALGARWDEINLAERTWIIPAERMKTGTEHRVPLSDAAIAIVERMAATRVDEYVFPGGRARRPLSNMALAIVLRRLGRGDVTTHGFRATFASWAADRTNYPFEVRELSLGHAVGDAVVRAYQRSDLFDRRRRLMDEWATFCDSPAVAGEVVPLRASAAIE